MRAMSEFTAWADYLNVQLALAEIDERYAEKIHAKAQDTVLLREWASADKDSRVTIAKAERSLDPDVQEASDALDVAYAFRKQVKALYENAERDAALLSRELTRRVGREPAERRDRRWNP